MTAQFHTTTSPGGAVTVTAIGEIDLATAGTFRDTLTHATAGHKHLTIDLTAVDYLDSAGIRVLYEFAASHTPDILVQPHRSVAVALEISGLVDILTIRHPTADTTNETAATPP